MELETVNKLFLELSQVAAAKTQDQILLQGIIALNHEENAELKKKISSLQDTISNQGITIKKQGNRIMLRNAVIVARDRIISDLKENEKSIRASNAMSIEANEITNYNSLAEKHKRILSLESQISEVKGELADSLNLIKGYCEAISRLNTKVRELEAYQSSGVSKATPARDCSEQRKAHAQAIMEASQLSQEKQNAIHKLKAEVISKDAHITLLKNDAKVLSGILEGKNKTLKTCNQKILELQSEIMGLRNLGSYTGSGPPDTDPGISQPQVKEGDKVLARIKFNDIEYLFKGYIMNTGAPLHSLGVFVANPFTMDKLFTLDEINIAHNCNQPIPYNLNFETSKGVVVNSLQLNEFVESDHVSLADFLFR